MISIITPSHNPKYLKELEESIINQTYKCWEWIILLNNGAEYFSSNPQIKIYKCPINTKSIGALKKYACNLAIGEIIVEVDHDDILMPECLEEIKNAYDDKEIGFVYSDDAMLSDTFIPYTPLCGWTYYKIKFREKDLIVMNTQPQNPGRLGYIWFAPDHIRSWRKSVYDSIGGHNDKLEVCDDLDLMHRLYLVTKFKHIPKCLYVYRIDGDNSWIQRNEKIQQENQRMYKEDVTKLAERFCELNNVMKIDLCGGFNKPEGYTSIDVCNADIIADLNKGIPLPDNSCGIVRAFDALEYLENKQFIMSEIHRVLINGGLLMSMTPSTDGRGAFQDPTHVSYWNQNSFWYWTNPDQMRFINNTDIKFRECRLETIYPSKYHEDNKISYVMADLECMK
jgi:glycosyltransferase involved in cell wall biosynthesis